jgi:biopolymer transport protein ExbD
MFRRKEQDEHAPKPAVPVTPMLDMAFQLLSFFIFTFHGDAQYEVEMDLALPQDTSGRATDVNDVDMKKMAEKLPDLEDLNDVPTITAATQNDGTNNGKISALTVQDRTGANRSASSVGELEKLLKDEFPATDSNGVIKVRGDPRLKWYAVLQVMDACHRAGYTRVGFAAPLED